MADLGINPIEGISGSHDPVATYLELDQMYDNEARLAALRPEDRARHDARVAALCDKALDVVTICPILGENVWAHDLQEVRTPSIPYYRKSVTGQLEGSIYLSAGFGPLAVDSEESDGLVSVEVEGRTLTSSRSTVVVAMMVERDGVDASAPLFNFYQNGTARIDSVIPAPTATDKSPAMNYDLNFIDGMLRKMQERYKKLKQS